MAMGDPARYAAIAALTALVFAAICVVAGRCACRSLVNFISETILLGFKAGAALTIAMTQLPKLFGVPGGGEHFFERVWVLAAQLADTNLAVLGFGCRDRAAPRGRAAPAGPAGRARRGRPLSSRCR